MGKLIEIREHSGAGIGGEISRERFTVLLLNFLPRLAADRIADMQRHTETDECFVLLEGKAVLFAAEGADAPGEIEAYPLEQGRVYVVPQGIWHTQIMTEDAKILLVENTGTVASNSPRHPITEAQRAQIAAWGAQLV